MPINVLHISPCNKVGGSRNSLIALVQSLDPARYNPIVASPGPGALTDKLDEIGVKWFSMGYEPFRKGRYFLRLPSDINSIRRIIAENEIGLVHCNEHFSIPHVLAALNPGGTWAGLRTYLRGDHAPTPTTVPLVAHMRLSIDDRHIRNYRLAHVHRLIGVSQYSSEEFRNYPWAKERVRTVYNSVVTSVFDEAMSERGRVRESLGLGSDHFLIGMVGLICHRKRVLAGLEVFKQVYRQCPQARFLIMGDARHHNEGYARKVNQFIEDNHLTDAVLLLPWQNSPAPYFAAMDLLFFLSSDEGFGRVVIEAGVCGVPTLASNIPANRETIVSGKTGWIVGEPNAVDEAFAHDLPAMAGKTIELIGSPESLREMGANARKRVLENFSQEIHGQRTMQVFDEACEAFRNGPILQG